MNTARMKIFATATACLLAVAAGAVEPPASYGPVPSPRQLAWQKMELVGFAHFTVNTFTGKEWGYGDESEKIFNPTNFNADQIVRAAHDGGLKELILTCKHHDGFCLWPSAYTEHSVKNSDWENGKGDVVKAISEACKKYGLKFGVYLSPWDRNRADYGTPAYVSHYRDQLRELLTHYGPVSEVWFDGANGGDGYYGGAKETRKIDPETYYEWPATYKIIRELQPDACMFGGGDIRWVGNEHGIAGDPCWNTMNTLDFSPSTKERVALINHGDRAGTNWIPAECDVSIRPGWFYHAKEDTKVKTPKELVDLYYNSVGRGAVLLLNLPPDKNGQIAGPDIKSLTAFHQIIADTFKIDLAKKATITASNTRGDAKQFAPKNVVSGKDNKYWSTDDSVTNADLVFTFKKPVTFNVVRIREYLPLGQRVDAFALDQWKDGQWTEFAKGTSIGNCRLVRGEKIMTDKVRLRITQAPVCPAISEVGLFEENP